MRRLLRAPSPATVISLLALFIALGGVGYAATTIGSDQIANNSVASQDIKNDSVSSTDIRDRTIVTKDLSAKAVFALRGAPGPAGPAGVPGQNGAPGAPATSLFAYVWVDGADVVEVAYGKGVTKAEQVGVTSVPGRVDVFFERDLRGCVVQVTAGTGRPHGEANGFVNVTGGVLIDPDDAEGAFDNVARVLTFTQAGAAVDAPFLISAFC